MDHNTNNNVAFSCRVGVILAFLSNQKSYESVANVQTTLNRVVDIGVGYVNQTVDVCRLIYVLVCGSSRFT